MEEKKIKDLTGNRSEKISTKKPETNTKEPVQKQTVRRPFVRMSQPVEQMTEHISAKPAREESPADLQGSAQGKRHSDRNGRNDRDRRNHKNRDRREQTAPKEPKEAKEQTEGKEPVSEKNEPRQDRGNRRDRNRNRGNRPERREKPQQVQAEPTEKADKPEAKQKQEKSGGEVRRQEKQGGKPQNRQKQEQPAGKQRSDVRPARPQRVLQEAPAEAQEAKEEVFTDEQLAKDGLLFTLDEPENRQQEPVEEEPVEQFEVVGIRFRGMGKTYYFSPNGIEFAEGEHAILDTARGMEYGDIVLANRMVGGNEVVQPLKPVLRKATEADTARYLENRAAEDRARPIFLEKVEKNKLEMQLVDVEYTFDNTKLCFYFTAEGRVDFRELVKDLASVFRTRIELRQIGVRDEARLFGGLGVCGRPFCCKSFLADFVQVSIRMAKDQSLSLASSKISGSCGRLMCCLRYEQDTYEQETAQLPKKGSAVETPKGRAMLLECSFLTGKAKVSMDEDRSVRVFALSEIKALPDSKPERKPEPEAESVVTPDEPVEAE